MKLILLILLILLLEPLRSAESSRYFFSELTRSPRDFKMISRSHKTVTKRYYSTHSCLVNRGGYVRLPMKNKYLKVFEDIIPDLPKILSRIPLFEKADIKDMFVKRFGGLTNLNYGIIYKGEKYVLRIPNSSLSLVDRKSEREILEEVAAHHFTKRDLYFDVNTGIKLRPYIEGEELYTDRINPQVIVQVADLFCELHASPLRLPYVSNFDLIEEYREELRKRGVVFSET